MLQRRQAQTRRALLPVTLLALLAAVACVNQADLTKPGHPTPVAEVAPLPTLPRAAEIAPLPPLPVPDSPAPVAPIAPVADIAPAAFIQGQGVEGLSPKVLKAALDAVACARSRGISGQNDRLTVIDYSLPSTEPRLWVLDLAHGKVLFHELVAHGAGSGDNYATRFSNTMDSRQTSLGLFLTAGTYEGGNGYSLRLRGLDPGVNDLAEARSIVMHGAWYVSAQHAKEHGRLGRSWGCPALSQEEARPVIDAVKGGSFVFAYARSNEAVFASARKCGGNPSTSPARSTVATPAGVVGARAAALSLTTAPVASAAPLP